MKVLVELSREDIISMLKRVRPHYSVVDRIPSDLGGWVEGYIPCWQWYDIPGRYSDEELYQIYIMCRDGIR